MGSCLQSVSLITCTMHTHTLKTAEAHNVYTTGYTCLLDTNSTVDTGYTFCRTVDTGYT